MSMYVKNTVGRRRTSGWADRRRYFRHLIAQARLALKGRVAQKAAVAVAKH